MESDIYFIVSKEALKGGVGTYYRKLQSLFDELSS